MKAPKPSFCCSASWKGQSQLQKAPKLQAVKMEKSGKFIPLQMIFVSFFGVNYYLTFQQMGSDVHFVRFGYLKQRVR